MGARERLNERKKWREEKPFFTFLHAIFFRLFSLSLAPTICPWVSEDELGEDKLYYSQHSQ